jgi:hypothetical protein
VAAAILVSLVGSAPARASAWAAFHTPAWAVQCWVAGQEAPPVLTCSMSRDGSHVSMSTGGRGQSGVDPTARNYRDPYAARRLLGFGRYWRFGSRFGCVSRTSGLTCWNKAGHGWTLGRRGVAVTF